MSAGEEGGGCDLIEEWLEQMVIAPVDYGDPHLAARQGLRTGQAAEAGSHDDDVPRRSDGCGRPVDRRLGPSWHCGVRHWRSRMFELANGPHGWALRFFRTEGQLDRPVRFCAA